MRRGWLVLLVLVLAGCGGGAKSNGESSRSVSQIIADAQTAAKQATAVHVAGSLLLGGQPLQLDMSLAGVNGGEGSFSTDTYAFKVARVNGKVYVNGNEAFWKHFGGSPSQAKLFAGKWIVGPATGSSMSSFTPLTRLSWILTRVLHRPSGHITVATSKLNGKPVVALKAPTTPQGGGGTLYVAATGTPYVVQVSSTRGTLDFDGWNQPVTITAPKGAVSYAKLQAGGG